MKPEQRHVEQLLQSALQLPAGERTAFVAKIVDPELRAEVAMLLAAHFAEAQTDGGATAGDPPPALSVEPSPGTLLGHFRVEHEIGRGAMGVVYLAEDLNLGRPVALKLLPAPFHRDMDRVRRFEREARTAATLNHANILTVFEVGEWQGRSFLATEFVEGETLARRLTRGPLPLAEATRVGAQIAAALAAAHQAGIIHRDLKPANVMLRPDGTAKVLDFGLARLLQPSGTPDSMEDTMSQTAPNCVVGTPAYMAAEQWQGKPADARSDIYSFGCVLYEMLTGARITPQPRRIASPALRKIVSRCLEPEPSARWQSAAELERELRASDRARISRREIGVAVVVVVLAAGAGIAWYLGSPRGPVTSPSEYVQLTNFSDSATAPALSPDGRILAFFRGGRYFMGSGQVYVKLLPDGESKQLTNIPTPKYGLTFTPDGSRIAYTTLNPDPSSYWNTWTVPVLGGPPTRLLPNAAGLSWIAPDRILFSEVMSGTTLHMGIVTSRENRAGERQIYFPPHERAMAHYSSLSPDRHSILIVEMDGSAAWQRCRVVPFEGGSSGAQVGPPGACTAAAWSPDGRWMYFNVEVDGSTHLWRQQVPNGVPEQITFGPTEEEGLAVTPDGRALIASVGNRQSSVWIHDRSGDRPLALEGSASSPSLSADGKRVFCLLRKSNSTDITELWETDLVTGKSDAVLTGQRITDYAISPDQSHVAFTVLSGAGSQIFFAALDRSSPPRLVTQPGDRVSFGAEGQLIFRQLGEKANHLAHIQTDGTGLGRVTDTPILDKSGVSPDGEWATYASAGFIAVSTTRHVTRRFCVAPCPIQWSADGKYLYVTTNMAKTSAGRTLVIPLPHGFGSLSCPRPGWIALPTKSLPDFK